MTTVDSENRGIAPRRRMLPWTTLARFGRRGAIVGAGFFVVKGLVYLAILFAAFSCS